MSDTQTTGSPSTPPAGGSAPSNGTDAASNSATPFVEQAKQQAQKVVDQAQQKAGEVLGQAKDQTKSWASDQKNAVAQSLSDVAQAVLETGENLREKGPDAYGKYAEITTRAADAVDKASLYLRDTSVDQMINQVEGFGKREPMLFLVGAAALGFMAARFLKSSSRKSAGNAPAYNPDRYLPVPMDEEDRGVDASYGTTSAAG